MTALQALIQYYTREAGVRNLEREIGNVCRKVARKVVNAQAERARRSQDAFRPRLSSTAKPSPTIWAAEVPRLCRPRRRTKSAPPSGWPGPKWAARF